MTTETRYCPKCGGTMRSRLGNIECLNCGYLIDTVAEAEKALRKPPPSAPDFRSFDRGSITQGGFETPVDVRFRDEGPRDDPLRVEKWIVLGAEALLGFGSAALALWDRWGLLNPDLALVGPIYGTNMIIGTAIGILLQYWVFFGRNIGVKTACMFIQGCSLLSTAVGLYFALRMAQFMQYQFIWNYPETWIALGVSTAWTTWFITIVYRDVQYQTGND